jgi:hypothetical protein
VHAKALKKSWSKIKGGFETLAGCERNVKPRDWWTLFLLVLAYTRNAGGDLIILLKII